MSCAADGVPLHCNQSDQASICKDGNHSIQARKPKLVDRKPKFDQPETDTVAQKMLELAELQKQGKFKLQREHDVLSMAIGSKEHGRHLRGMSSKLSIKDEFEKD